MYKKIMVPLDGSTLAECVLPHVNGFITDCQVETIIFVSVVQPEPISYSGASRPANPQHFVIINENRERIEKERKSFAVRYLQNVIRELKHDEIKCKADVLVGTVADRLVDYIIANEIDLVLIATHGRSGISRWVRGSIADKVLRSSSAPVLMVRADGTMSEEKA
jgi:nucleotide-binding universal stress UspA family protein